MLDGCIEPTSISTEGEVKCMSYQTMTEQPVPIEMWFDTETIEAIVNIMNESDDLDNFINESLKDHTKDYSALDEDREVIEQLETELDPIVDGVYKFGLSSNEKGNGEILNTFLHGMLSPFKRGPRWRKSDIEHTKSSSYYPSGPFWCTVTLPWETVKRSLIFMGVTTSKTTFEYFLREVVNQRVGVDRP